MLVLCPCQPAAGYDQDRKGDLVEVHVEGGDVSKLPAYHGTVDYTRTNRRRCSQYEIRCMKNQH